LSWWLPKPRWLKKPKCDLRVDRWKPPVDDDDEDEGDIGVDEELKLCELKRESIS
jgi:hypothetical protein